MRVCVGSAAPGGLDAEVALRFEDSDLFDYYIVEPGKSKEQVAQTRRCSCADLVESVIRRGVDAVIVKDLSPANLLRFANEGVGVFVAPEVPARSALDLMLTGRLQEIGLKDLSRLGRKHGKGV